MFSGLVSRSPGQSLSLKAAAKLQQNIGISKYFPIKNALISNFFYVFRKDNLLNYVVISQFISLKRSLIAKCFLPLSFRGFVHFPKYWARQFSFNSFKKMIFYAETPQ